MRTIVKDAGGVVRFRANAIVVRLFEETIKHGFGLHQLEEIRPSFTKRDWEDFLQLIGWPIESYCAVDLVSKLGAQLAAATAHEIFPNLF